MADARERRMVYMPELRQSTAILRVLGQELRDRRKLRGFTLEDVVTKLRADGHQISTMTLSRIETARARPQQPIIVALADIYSVTPADGDAIMSLFHQAADTTEGWWKDYPHLGPYVPLEAAATKAKEWAPFLVPGSLQTEEYATAIYSLRYTGRDLAVRVEARMRRQERFAEPGFEFVALIDESVLYRTLGDPEMLGRQLDALIVAAARPATELRIMPFDAPPHSGLDGPCVFLWFGGLQHGGREHAPIAVSDTGMGMQIADLAAEQESAARNLRQAALPGEQSVDLLKRRVRELRAG